MTLLQIVIRALGKFSERIRKQIENRDPLDHCINWLECSDDSRGFEYTRFDLDFNERPSMSFSPYFEGLWDYDYIYIYIYIVLLLHYTILYLYYLVLSVTLGLMQSAIVGESEGLKIVIDMVKFCSKTEGFCFWRFGLVSLFGISTIFRLFNTKDILLEEQ